MCGVIYEGNIKYVPGVAKDRTPTRVCIKTTVVH